MKHLTAAISLFCICLSANAQLLFVPRTADNPGASDTLSVPEPSAYLHQTDSIPALAAADTVFLPRDSSFFAVDTLFAGRNIFDAMPSREEGGPATVTITQPEAVRRAIEERAASEPSGQLSGYRVRIYFSNSQNAREESSAALSRFGARYPEHKAYRSYVNPNFKVTVGNFRTKSEALALLNDLKYIFPASFVVKEKIEYCY